MRKRTRSRLARLETDLAEVMSAVEENRRLNERLSDVLDVITELLLPATDRDEATLREALSALTEGAQRPT